MFCPKCRAKIGLYRLKAATQNSIAQGVSCALCGYWMEHSAGTSKTARN